MRLRVKIKNLRCLIFSFASKTAKILFPRPAWFQKLIGKLFTRRGNAFDVQMFAFGKYGKLRYPRESGNKFKNRKVQWHDEWFDSEAELGRYRELQWLQKHGDITELRRQVRFELIPSQRDDHGNTIERPVHYVADFVYRDQDDRTVVEDVKGMATKEYILKRKLMYYRYHIRIREIRA